MNVLSVIGNLCKDNELRFLNNEKQTAVLTGNIAVKRGYAKEGTQDTDFIKFVIFGKAAESFNKYTKKGSKVGLVGEINIDKQETAEGNRYWTKLKVDKFDFLTPKQQDDSGYTNQVENNDFNKIKEETDAFFNRT
jgi:single-strand DNA-binding protein